MKITDIKAFPVWIGHRNQLLVKIETDAGFYGWGEAGFTQAFLDEFAERLGFAVALVIDRP